MERPLRFCQITTFYPPYSFGGDAVYVHALSNELAARGHHVEVIYSQDSYRALSGGEPKHAATNHPNIVLHGLESRWGALDLLGIQQTGAPFFHRREIQRILAQGFDVIHYHNISLVGGPKILEMGNALKLYSTHEYWLVCPTHVLFRYDGVACQETKCLRCTLHYHRPPQAWRYTNTLNDAVKNVDLFLHPTTFSQQKHSEMGLHVPHKIMPYFHTPHSDAITATTPPPATPYFLYVGRLEFLKGVHTLIPTFREYPRARLLIAGEGNQRAELEALAQDSPNIEFLGWQNATQLADLYHHATALIISSLCYECGPLVLLEALSNRTPIIGRSLGTIPEFIQSTGSGLVFSDDASLRVLLDQMLDHPEQRLAMAESGYAAYERDYTVDVHMSRYFDLIESVMETKQGT